MFFAVLPFILFASTAVIKPVVSADVVSPAIASLLQREIYCFNFISKLLSLRILNFFMSANLVLSFMFSLFTGNTQYSCRLCKYNVPYFNSLSLKYINLFSNGVVNKWQCEST